MQSEDLDSVEEILVESEYRGGEGEGERERVVDQRNEQSHAPLHLACTTGNMYVSNIRGSVILIRAHHTILMINPVLVSPAAR